VIPKDFSSTLRYRRKDEPAILLSKLDELGQRSEEAKVRRRWWVAALVLWMVVGLCGVIAAGGNAWCIVGVLYAIAGGIVFGLLIHKASRQILDDRRRKLAKVVLGPLACDLPRAGKLELEVDFNPWKAKHYQRETWKLTAYSATAYCHPWLTVRGTLADGARFELTTDLLARCKERSKSKGRKKVKEDLCEQVSLTLRVPSLPPAAPQRWPDLVQAAPMPPGAFVHRAVVKDDRVTLTVRTHRHVRVTDKGTVISGADVETKLANRHTLLAPLLAAYHALHACRAG
jgi:hypothetical protein